MNENRALLKEVDRCIEKLMRIRMPIYAVYHMAEEIAPEIYALCEEHRRMDIRYAMDDIVSTLQRLKGEIFAFQPEIDKSISG